MLDQHDGDALRRKRSHQIGHGRGFAAAEAGQRLVEQQELRIERNRAADLQALALAERQRRGDCSRLRRQPDALADRLRLLARRLRERLVRARHGLSGLVVARRQHDVLDGGEAMERPDNLVREAEAQPHARMRRQARHVALVEEDAAAVGPQDARHHAQSRRLAGAVGTDHRQELAALDRKAHAIGGGHAAEADMQVVDAGKRAHAGRRRTRPARPPGLNRITSISIAPKISSR